MEYITFYYNEVQEESPNCVNLMTIHTSKGLEFDYVFLLDWNQGSIPIRNADLEEERRLAFVGLTRAKNSFYVFYLQQDDDPSLKPSQFIRECLNTGQGSDIPLCCYYCKKQGHFAKSCPLKQGKCFRCDGLGHLSAKCPSLVCSHCRRTGHYARDCEARDYEAKR